MTGESQEAQHGSAVSWWLHQKLAKLFGPTVCALSILDRYCRSLAAGKIGLQLIGINRCWCWCWRSSFDHYHQHLTTADDCKHHLKFSLPCCQAYRRNKERDCGRKHDSLWELSFISWYNATLWMAWATNSMIANCQETKWPISFICIICIQNYWLKAQSKTFNFKVASNKLSSQFTSRHEEKYYRPTHFICSCIILRFWLAGSNQVKTKTEMHKAEMKSQSETETKKPFKTETKLKHD